MSKRFFAAAFAIGLACVAWVGLGFVGNNLLALAVTVLIGAAFTLGAWELRQYRAATATLQAALDGMRDPSAAPSNLGDWLRDLPAGLRDAVRQRVEGERGVLPAPALTPYLVGLLVMLGMLGTFLGMVVTFKGAVFALEGSGDLAAMRAALAEPIKGLGLSFGTSVAGVATSALLGLMSTLARRERQEAARLLDACIAGSLRPFSRARQREAALDALQAQAGALPAVVERLDALMQRIEQRAQSLDAQLVERQDRFQKDTAQAYTQLGQRVGDALQDSLAAGARAAGDTMRPLVESAMKQMLEQSQQLQQRLTEAAQAQGPLVETTMRQLLEQSQQVQQRITESAEAQRPLVESTLKQLLEQSEQVQQRLVETAQAQVPLVEATMNQLVAQSQGVQQRLTETAQAQVPLIEATMQQLLEQSQATQQRLGDTAQAQADQLSDRFEASARALAQVFSEAQQALAQDLRAQWQQAAQDSVSQQQTLNLSLERAISETAARMDALQAASAQHLATLGAALEAPMSRMMQTAAEVPQAAAGVIAQLREELARMTERENLALQEREALITQLQQLLGGLEQSSGAQARAIDTLVTSTTSLLEQAAERQQQALQAQSEQAAGLSEQARASAVELASLGEAFAQGVQHFQDSQDKLLEGLLRLENALDRAQARSDEQLAYYVGQAREVIDLSISSQQGLIEKLHQLRQPGATPQQPALEGTA